MKWQQNAAVVVYVVLTAFPATAELRAASFQGLGDLPGGDFCSHADGVSADGSIVVGWSGSTLEYGREAFRWTQAGGMVGLGWLPGGPDESYAEGVSADGSAVVGMSRDSSDDEAFRWTESSGMIGLGYLPGGLIRSWANGVSADGSVVVGMSFCAAGIEAYRWTESSGMIGLGDLPGGPFYSWAVDVSADGSVVVGLGHVGDGVRDFVAYRWTESDGMVALGSLPGGDLDFQSAATAVSADGSVTVGFSSSTQSPGSFAGEAFRWTETGGMIGLGDLPGGGFESQARGVSADGSVIVGQGRSDVGAAGLEAFIWDATRGMRSLQDVLTDAGLDMTGWQLSSANDISPDGTVIVGYGYNPDGKTEAWRAVIPELEADFDGDGDVDGDDFLAWQSGFGTQTDAQKSDGDYDNDGDVDGADFLGWQMEFGSGSGSASAAVPEPASMMLAIVVAVAGTFSRRRGRRCLLL